MYKKEVINSNYNIMNSTSLSLLDAIEENKLESIDTLVYTSSLFVIPINIAALNHKFLLMNIYIFLALTSWAHHACRHMKVKKSCIYDEVDRFACITSCVYIIMYTLFYTSLRKFFITVAGIMCVLICYYRVCKNRNDSWENRGLKNWKYQKPHIAMHLTAVIVGIYVALIE